MNMERISVGILGCAHRNGGPGVCQFSEGSSVVRSHVAGGERSPSAGKPYHEATTVWAAGRRDSCICARYRGLRIQAPEWINARPEVGFFGDGRIRGDGN